MLRTDPRRLLILATASIAAGVSLPTLAQEQLPSFTDEQLAFFETRIRPVLADNCYECHSHESKKVQADLYLDSRSGFIDTVIAEPGNPDESLLILAVRWELRHTEMPPTHKLSDQEIADLTRWVEIGLPWPEEAAPDQGNAQEPEVFDLEARRQAHWAWHAPRRAEGLPEAAAESTSATIDALIGARLAEADIAPSPEADRATLIRRVTFDLTGLPPSPAEVEAFVNDPNADAYEALIDRLLASPRFGEKWARHHLDLVRYAETMGHEFDFNIEDPWRYRDYVIRALNNDIPYDQFVREHIAGDLLDRPRIDPETGENQSALATGFYWLGEQTHAPVDVMAHQADRIDNQIDVLTKTFQGLTVACARCHDHKFDAISTADYYALYGIMQSTQWSVAELVEHADRAESDRAMDGLRAGVESAVREQWDPAGERIDAYLLAATGIMDQTFEIKDRGEKDQQITALCAERADELGLDPDRLRGWVHWLSEWTVRDGQHPLHAWHRMTTAKPQDAANWWRNQRNRAVEQLEQAGDHADTDPKAIELFRLDDPTSFSLLGSGFTANPTPANRLLPAAGRGQGPGQIMAMPGLSTAGTASRDQGALRTPTRTIERRYIHVLAQGNDARINIVINGLRIIRDPIYGRFRKVVNHPYPHWYTFDLQRCNDGAHNAYVEVVESHAGEPAYGGGPVDATVTVYRIIASDHREPGYAPGLGVLANLATDEPPSPESLARAYQERLVQAAQSWQAGAALTGPEEQSRNALLSTLISRGLLEWPTIAPSDASAPTLAQRLDAFHQADRTRPVATMGLAAADGHGRDTPIFTRGNPHAPGELVPRGYLTAIVGQTQPAPASNASPAHPDTSQIGSGRFQLADTLTDPRNPLTARVQVNRLWHHLFGRGLVASVDNFGLLGTPPTHPQLLDHLAVSFMEDDAWSTKAMIRHIVLTRTYRQASAATNLQDEERDPDNLLLRRQNLRRLTAEAIRDNILAVSGQLDETMFGQSVPPHLTAFMNGRGRPQSGPLDGNGRRSIYLGVRRNFLSPMMLTFDAPIPFSTVGARNTTNVPAQALILMNDPFVHDQAGKWADRLVKRNDNDASARIDAMCRSAMGRPATGPEREALLAYLENQSTTLGLTPDQELTDPRPWRELAHVMFNLKGFSYVR